MTTLHDLVMAHEWAGVLPVLVKAYPDQATSVVGYKEVFDVLRTLKPKPSEMQILAKWCEDDFAGTEFVDVSGIKKGDELSYSLSWVDWAEWLSMSFAPESHKLSEPELIAHCLYDMTFYGYTQEEIAQVSREVVGRMEEVIATELEGGMTEEKYERALVEIEYLMNTVPDTEEGSQSEARRRMMELAFAVETYEDEHYPMD